MPRMMRALLAQAKGEMLRLVQVDTPRPGPGEVLLRVVASAVNPLDTKIRAGTADHAGQPLPAILGIMRQAAALPLAVITAWAGLVDRAAVCSLRHVLVLGGAGGVGQMVLQLARARGATISATGSPAARTAVEALAAQFVDRAEPAAEVVARLTGGRGFDIVFDTTGGPSLDAAFTMVRRFGHVVSALGWGTHALAPLSFRAASYAGIFTLLPLLTGEGRDHHGAILAEATKLAEAGELVPALDVRRFTLATANDAYNAIETGTARGKLVVDVAAEDV